MIRVLITRPRKDALGFAKALGEIGAETIFFPTIDIRPVGDTTTLDRAISHLHEYDWLVLTSANAVDIILDRKAALGMERFPENLRLAAVGSKTAARFVEGGVVPDFVPEEFIAEAILPGLGDLKGRRVLLPVADIAPDTLQQAIQQAGGTADRIAIYQTLPPEPDPDGLAAVREGVDVITFTSGSTVQNFVALVQRAGLDPLHLPHNPQIACIGPNTARTAQELGYFVDIVAVTHTVEGLVQAIATNLRKPLSHESI